MDSGQVSVEILKSKLAELEKDLASHKVILAQREAEKWVHPYHSTLSDRLMSHPREKEFKEYKELERSKSKKWMAKLVPGGTQALDKNKVREASEWQEAQALENKQRDAVNRLDDTIRSVQKMVSLQMHRLQVE